MPAPPAASATSADTHPLMVLLSDVDAEYVFYKSADGGFSRKYLYLVIPPGADPAAFELKPLDGEIESFDANCAVAIIDLFIRLDY
ncbi:hypothetical protein FB451DRAFT_1407919 [Mycena latifolia]|nr:hypothetical protein FB451DRAFT_1407919 [Mycena latifolia]